MNEDIISSVNWEDHLLCPRCSIQQTVERASCFVCGGDEYVNHTRYTWYSMLRCPICASHGLKIELCDSGFDPDPFSCRGCGFTWWNKKPTRKDKR